MLMSLYYLCSYLLHRQSSDTPHRSTSMSLSLESLQTCTEYIYKAWFHTLKSHWPLCQRTCRKSWQLYSERILSSIPSIRLSVCHCTFNNPLILGMSNCITWQHYLGSNHLHRLGIRRYWRNCIANNSAIGDSYITYSCLHLPRGWWL
ncbi:hypothetical protein FGO68_gene1163 [Halteria grandinella]|uniref:Uncharacterized protein n=1 Tax=Halteria grandinella TaxID=5974 RepID=A0A8J8P785_HALGN|nr:hypothetical protein FGO68_gene1163 [Halteria grandinella]